jgi:environmental stress-induced protein Ves
MQILRYAELAASPWKNGGGITREVLRHPKSGAFSWRLSLAEVGQSGPFSEFVGYRRIMMLLEGHGLRLQAQGLEDQVLLEAGALIEFPGAQRTHCELIDGPCIDLNLMFRESLPVPSVQVLDAATLREGRALRAAAGSRDVLVAVALADGDLALEGTHESHGAALRLGRWDTAVLAPEDGERRLVAEGARAGTRAGAGAGAGAAMGTGASRCGAVLLGLECA